MIFTVFLRPANLAAVPQIAHSTWVFTLLVPQSVLNLALRQLPNWEISVVCDTDQRPYYRFNNNSIYRRGLYWNVVQSPRFSEAANILSLDSIHASAGLPGMGPSPPSTSRSTFLPSLKNLASVLGRPLWVYVLVGMG